MKDRIIAAIVCILFLLCLTACQDTEQTKSVERDKPVASIDTHKRLEGWTITVYAEEGRVFQYSGDIELGRAKEIIVRTEGGHAEE